MQVSWIDADDVRDSVAKLVEPPTRGGPASMDLHTLPDPASGIESDLVTEKPAAPPQQPDGEVPLPTAPGPDVDMGPEIALIRERLRLIRDRAQEAGLLTKEPKPQIPPPPPAVAHVSPPELPPMPEPVAEIPPIAAPSPVPIPRERTTITERLDEFAHWVAKLTTSEETFMLDEHGDLLWGSPTSDDLIVLAKLAMNTTQRSNAATLSQPSAATHMTVATGRELQLVFCPTRHGVVTLVMMNPQQVPTASLREAMALAIDK